jgi:hypothetical protein
LSDRPSAPTSANPDLYLAKAIFKMMFRAAGSFKLKQALDRRSKILLDDIFKDIFGIRVEYGSLKNSSNPHVSPVSFKLALPLLLSHPSILNWLLPNSYTRRQPMIALTAKDQVIASLN